MFNILNLEIWKCTMGNILIDWVTNEQRPNLSAYPFSVPAKEINRRHKLYSWFLRPLRQQLIVRTADLTLYYGMVSSRVPSS